MRIIYRDLKNQKIKILTENLDDLWHLKNIIDPGDQVNSITWRRPKIETDKVRPERREKERVNIKLRVEKTEFHKFSNRLRILGEIEEGPDKGEHHTLNINTNSKLTVIKEWKDYHLQRLREARKASNRPKILLIAVDDESATFGIVRQYGLEEITRIESRKSGKLYETDRESEESEFYNDICSTINNLIQRKNIPRAIIAGPGFTKKEIYEKIKEKYSEITRKIHLGSTSTGGRSGLNEIIRRGIVKRVSEKDRISLETELIEEMIRRITKNGLATYGEEEVKKAVELGAVEKLLLTDKTLRGNRLEMEKILNKVRKKGGEVMILSTEHEAGRQLMNLGGIGALLRFKTS